MWEQYVISVICSVFRPNAGGDLKFGRIWKLTKIDGSRFGRNMGVYVGTGQANNIFPGRFSQNLSAIANNQHLSIWDIAIFRPNAGGDLADLTNLQNCYGTRRTAKK